MTKRFVNGKACALSRDFLLKEVENKKKKRVPCVNGACNNAHIRTVPPSRMRVNLL